MSSVVAVSCVFGTVCPVICSVYFVLAVDCFDNVDFAAGGPSNGVEIFSEHPEGGPNSFACRECNASFYRSVLESEFAFGEHAR